MSSRTLLGSFALVLLAGTASCGSGEGEVPIEELPDAPDDADDSATADVTVDSSTTDAGDDVTDSAIADTRDATVLDGSDASGDARLDADGGDANSDTGSGDGGFPLVLSQNDLYSNFGARTISGSYTEYAPAHALWSDGEVKRRWIRLPTGAQIDSTDMDKWVFPVGTKVWKEFAMPNGLLLETRLLEKIGPGVNDWRVGSYVWNVAQNEATWSLVGEEDILGTTHDVPSLGECNACHQALKVNGFQAIQLSKPGPGVNLESIRSWLSNPPPVGVDYPIPGNAVEEAALGSINANCGHCHTPGGNAAVSVNMMLRPNVAERTVETTQPWLTSFNVRTSLFMAVPFRIKCGDSTNSAIAHRMSLRGGGQMPPVGTEVVDTVGLAAVKTWIDSTTCPPEDAGGDASDSALADTFVEDTYVPDTFVPVEDTFVPDT